MLRNFISITLLLFFGSCLIANAAPTQLVPCEELFKLSPIHQKYFNYLSNHYGSEGRLHKLKPIFTMYIIPSFEPESAVTVYRVENNYFIEQFSSEESLWYSLKKQSRQEYQGLQYVPPGIKFNLPAITSKRLKKISRRTGKQIENATKTAIKSSRLIVSEFEKNTSYLDGTSFYYISSDKTCARPFGYSDTGVVKDMDVLAAKLIDFLSDSANEGSIISATEKVLNNYK